MPTLDGASGDLGQPSPVEERFDRRDGWFPEQAPVSMAISSQIEEEKAPDGPRPTRSAGEVEGVPPYAPPSVAQNQPIAGRRRRAPNGLPPPLFWFRGKGSDFLAAFGRTAALLLRPHPFILFRHFCDRGHSYR